VTQNMFGMQCSTCGTLGINGLNMTVGLNILCLDHCFFHACPQYTEYARLEFLVVNIEYLTTVVPVSNESII